MEQLKSISSDQVFTTERGTKKLTSFDIFDIFGFPENGDLCQFNHYCLTKEDFLSVSFFESMSNIKSCMLYIIMPTDNIVTLIELSDFFDVFRINANTNDILWGLAENDTIKHYEVFLVSTYSNK